jgi:hypothetical protein
MRRLVLAGWIITAAGLVLLAQACGDDSTSGGTPDAGKPDASTQNTVDGSTPQPDDGSTPDTGSSVDAGTDGPEPCSAAWIMAPTVDPSIAAEAGTSFLHASATGTQNYECEQTADAGGTYQWVFVGPQANLYDCNATQIGQHFASEAGAAAPEWMTTGDDSYVIAKKHTQFVPSGGADSVPWLLLYATSTGGSGDIATTQEINRLNTDGGNAPDAASCDNGSTGTIQKIPYSADYYFYK